MKYKLKFEIVYPGLDKSEIRELKLDGILSDINTEVESDSPLTPPSKDDIIILGNDVEYLIIGIKHKIESNLYTIIVEVENKQRRIRINEEISKKEMEAMFNNNELILPDNPNDRIYRKIYLDTYEGQEISNLWLDIPIVNPICLQWPALSPTESEDCQNRKPTLQQNPCLFGSARISKNSFWVFRRLWINSVP